MKEIKTRDEANKYYKLLNELVDDFIDKSKARPIEVYNYIKRNSEKFLQKNNLTEIIGINKILEDIIHHRRSLQLDKIITFEKYIGIFENIQEIKSKNTYKEKLLADFFHTSAGHIDILNQDLNIYKVKDFDKEVMVAILSDYDLSILKNGLKKLLKVRIISQNFQIDEISQEFLQNPQKLKISELIDDNKLSMLLDKLIDLDASIKYFQFYLLNNGLLNFEVNNLELIGNENGYKIWRLIV